MALRLILVLMVMSSPSVAQTAAQTSAYQACLAQRDIHGNYPADCIAPVAAFQNAVITTQWTMPAPPNMSARQQAIQGIPH